MPFTFKVLFLGFMTLSSLSLFACQGQLAALKAAGAEIEAADEGVESGDSFIPENPSYEGTPDRPGATNPSTPRDEFHRPPDAQPDAGEVEEKFHGDDDPSENFHEMQQVQEFAE